MTHNPLTVLIVDDNPLITLFISDIVTNKGDKVLAVCHDSESAQNAIKEYKPELIFMDINIKGPLDGITVIRKVVNYRPIIYFISAYSSEDIIKEALSTHAYNYLVKPIKERDIEIALMLSRNKSKELQRSVEDKIYLTSDVYFDRKSGETIFKNNHATLSSIQQKLIKLFMENLNNNLSLDYIKQELWEDQNITNSTIRDHISSLRKKIPELKIETNFGRGYLLKTL